jgi:hypothetical protein
MSIFVCSGKAKFLLSAIHDELDEGGDGELDERRLDSEDEENEENKDSSVSSRD